MYCSCKETSYQTGSRAADTRKIYDEKFLLAEESCCGFRYRNCKFRNSWSGLEKIDKMLLKCYFVCRRNKLMRVLDAQGNIAEPTSRNYGKPPDPDSKREQRLLWWGCVWLLIPVMGVIPYSMVRRELTNRWGHRPWWLF